MGLFDGAAGDNDAGSTAGVARWLQGRVLLVLDARAQARSAAALAQGFARFDRRLEFAGVICNRVGSDRHARLLETAFASVPGLPPLLGCLPREVEVALPERHLGLVTAADAVPDEAFYEGLADWLERHVDVDRFFTLPLTPSHQGRGSYAEKLPSPPVGEGQGEGEAVRIAVARDEAFCFCYPENLELLQAAGAEIVPFSPLRDPALPAGIAGLYLPGGYPELHAATLAANGALRARLRAAAEQGLPTYAECGGLMLLAEAIDGQPMAGVFPGTARMLPRRKALGYRAVTLAQDTLLGPAGTVVRGHEFHYSELDLPAGIERCYRLQRSDGTAAGTEGFRIHNTLGSYVHLHFGSNPQVATAFVAFCRRRTALASG
jgi:cobyrinic acid a,c-diamide synthase